MTEQQASAPDAGRQDSADFDWNWADDDPGWVAPAIDTSRPNVARMYDYSLGGKDNFAADREAAHSAWEVMPDGPALARANRKFLMHAVGVIGAAGVDQFLDLGAGIPTSPATHEMAQAANPAASVVYVDHDPVVLAHTRALVRGIPRVRGVLHDVRDPAGVLNDPGLQRSIDLGRPVGLLMIAVLHFVDVTLGRQVVRRYLDLVPSGSHLAFSVATFDGVPPEVSRHVEEVYRNSSSPIVFRSLAQVEDLLDGSRILAPGVVEVSHWDDTLEGPLTMRMHSGIAVKP